MSTKFLSIAAVVLVLFPVSSRASTLAYATTGDDQFGIVDLNTGVFTEGMETSNGSISILDTVEARIEMFTSLR
jgi:hypothetical protein